MTKIERMKVKVMLTMLCSCHLDLVPCCRPKLESMLLCCLNQILDHIFVRIVAVAVVDADDAGPLRKQPNKRLLISKQNEIKQQ